MITLARKGAPVLRRIDRSRIDRAKVKVETNEREQAERWIAQMEFDWPIMPIRMQAALLAMRPPGVVDVNRYEMPHMKYEYQPTKGNRCPVTARRQ